MIEALRDLAEWFEREKLPAAIIGGVAASIRGRPSLTRDIDAVVFALTTRICSVLRKVRVRRAVRGRGTDLDISFGTIPFEEEVVQR